MALPPILRFHETYFERIWGGTLMREVLGLPVPDDKVIGEAWLVSDHPHCESVIAEGPLAGATLRHLVAEHGVELLGRAAPTPHGRFPLLLKLIDAGDLLSVQVHPDDDDARRLGEPDVGKTEMWHVLHALPEAKLICGIKPGIDRAAFEAAIAARESHLHLEQFPAPARTNVFVPAGTVHAIGGGLLIAEIQQNSDITYRVYDWDRVDAQGRGRELHIERALEVTRFEGTRGPHSPTPHTRGEHAIEILAHCNYFTAERIAGVENFPITPGGHSFHLFLAAEGDTHLRADGETCTLKRGSVALIPACAREVLLSTDGAAIDYFVPAG